MTKQCFARAYLLYHWLSNATTLSVIESNRNTATHVLQTVIWQALKKYTPNEHWLYVGQCTRSSVGSLSKINWREYYGPTIVVESSWRNVFDQLACHFVRVEEPTCPMTHTTTIDIWKGLKFEWLWMSISEVSFHRLNGITVTFSSQIRMDANVFAAFNQLFKFKTVKVW